MMSPPRGRRVTIYVADKDWEKVALLKQCHVLAQWFIKKVEEDIAKNKSRYALKECSSKTSTCAGSSSDG